MQKIYIDGIEVEMGGEVDGFQFVSAVEGLDKKHASRSESVKIPMTPHNMVIFGFPNHADQWGGGVRSTHTAELYYSGGVVRGTFKVTGVSATEITGAIIYGGSNLVQGGALSRKLSELISPPDNIVMRAGKWYWEKSHILGTHLYFNGYDADAASGFRLPSVQAAYLVQLLEKACGFTADAAYKDTDINIVLPTMKAIDDWGASGTIMPNHNIPYTLSSGLSTYLENQILVIQDDGGGNTRPEYVLRAKQRCRIHISGTNADGVFSLTSLGEKKRASHLNVGWRKIPAEAAGQVRDGSYLANIIEAEDIRKSCDVIFDLEVGDFVCYWRYVWNSGYRQWGDWGNASAFTCEAGQAGGELQLSQDGSGWNYGSYYLNANLPDMSAVDLLRALAVAKSCELVYDESSNTFGMFDFDFDAAGDSVISLDGRCKVGAIKRQALDFGQVHEWGLQRGEFDYYSEKTNRMRSELYVTPNQTLTEKTETFAPVVAGSPAQVDGASAFISCVIPCGGTDDQGHPTCKAMKNPILTKMYTNYAQDGATAGRLTPIDVQLSAPIEQICKMSTAVEVEVPMRLFEFMQVRTTTRFTMLGGWWFCRAATFQGGTAKLKLQRYK